MLRRASATCGFTAYNPAIVDRARVCFNAIGSRHGTEEIRAGVVEFEQSLAVNSKHAICATLAAKFPMVVLP
jgi:hypothetical protein